MNDLRTDLIALAEKYRYSQDDKERLVAAALYSLAGAYMVGDVTTFSKTLLAYNAGAIERGMKEQARLLGADAP